MRIKGILNIANITLVKIDYIKEKRRLKFTNIYLKFNFINNNSFNHEIRKF